MNGKNLSNPLFLRNVFPFFFFLIFYFYSSTAEAWLQAFCFRIPEDTKRFRKWPSISIYNLYTYFGGNKKWWKARPAELENSCRSFFIFCTKNKKNIGRNTRKHAEAFGLAGAWSLFHVWIKTGNIGNDVSTYVMDYEKPYRLI